MARLEAVGANAVGCNCSSGPATVLSVIECMRKVTTLPLVAMPNAGMPRNVEGRNIYLTSPEYMASFARKFVKAGASWVGGCCGTTPNAYPRDAERAAGDGGAGQSGEKAAGERAVRAVDAGGASRCSRRRWRSGRRLGR